MHDPRSDTPQRAQPGGFALATAVLALVLVGALVTGGFYASSQEDRITRSHSRTGEALQAAEYGLHRKMNELTLAEYAARAVGESSNPDTLAAGDQRQAIVTVTRLAPRLHLISSTGQVLVNNDVAAERSVGVLMRTLSMQIQQDRAMQVYGRLNVGGNAQIVGEDVTPPGWLNTEECPNRGTQAGVVARDTTLIDYKDKKQPITGEPPLLQDASLDSTAFHDFGDLDFDRLAALASKRIPDGLGPINNTGPVLDADGNCVTENLWNWGGPGGATNACANYFPIIHAEGNLTLNGGAGAQGILLVEGDLEMMGGFEFNGIIIVKGSFSAARGNADIRGTTIVYGNGNVGLETESDLRGTAIVNFSSCAIERAIRNNSDLTGTPVSERNWIDLSAAGVTI